MKLQAVIGAQFGDEGKGLITDYLARPRALVVRHNGGAQAGHTVITPEGLRHEFHHVGAGSFRGAHTLLARRFIVNPLMLVQELHTIHKLLIGVDHRCPVTTPFDMILNRCVEDVRGENRHGSCGLGINETMTRHLGGFSLEASALAFPRVLHERLNRIEHEWLPARCQTLDIKMPRIKRYVIEDFIDACASMAERMILCTDISFMKNHKHVIFEGAQGLRLDEVHGTLPHVTRSRTGLTNVQELLEDAGWLNLPLDAFYVTRCYVTRHGAGPLTDEQPGHPFGWRGPETNIANVYQGHLRYAPLKMLELRDALACDERWDAVIPRLAITCLDQLPGFMTEHYAQDMAEITGLPIGLLVNGATREHVHHYEEPREATG